MGYQEACCNVPSNLELKDSGKQDLELKVCKVCGRRHFELTMDPGVYAFTPVSITPPAWIKVQ